MRSHPAPAAPNVSLTLPSTSIIFRTIFIYCRLTGALRNYKISSFSNLLFGSVLISCVHAVCSHFAYSSTHTHINVSHHVLVSYHLRLLHTFLSLRVAFRFFFSFSSFSAFFLVVCVCRILTSAPGFMWKIYIRKTSDEKN